MAVAHFQPLPAHLVAMQAEIEQYARGYGLDFYTTIFELVDADQLNAIAAYGGFPTRYPHWRFGMEYERLSKGYHYGLQKIYEMVINNDPCYAYLMSSNGDLDQKLVMAHVYGHCDFFKNNQYFAHTNRKMMDGFANHGNRIRRYMDRFGVSEVEEFIDACTSVDDLIDLHSTFIQRRPKLDLPKFASEEVSDEDAIAPGRLRAKGYMDPYINPPHILEAHSRELREKKEAQETHFPAEAERDVMLFLLEHAPLSAWQADILSMCREEAYYFAPQAQTKIMNEGWASYWHSTIMTRQGLTSADVVNYADHHAGTMASSPTQLNPYKLGIELFRDIEDRWNKGRFGKQYEECEDLAARREWDTEAGLGREKIFEVRRIHNDLTFIDSFLTLEFCRENRMFQFGYNEAADAYEIESRAFPQVKQQLLANLTNLGRPQIVVRDANHRNRGELFLQHQYSGVELDLNYGKDSLVNVHRLWKRPVHIQTVLDDAVTILSFDGTEHEVVQGDEVSI